MESGYHANFNLQLDDEYKCSICQGVYRQPMQLPCGHRFCKTCLDNNRETQEQRGAQFSCPIDREAIEMNQVFPDRAIERYVLSLGVKCNNLDHCTWVGELRGLESHMQKCPFNSATCDHCNTSYFLKDKQVHITECDNWPTKCVNSCGAEDIPRKDMASHSQICPMAKFPCIYEYLGCPFMGTNVQIKSHLAADIDKHLAAAILKMTSHNEDLEKKHQMYMKKNEDMEKKVEMFAKATEDIERKLEESTKYTKDLEKKVEASEKKYLEIEQKLEISMIECEVKVQSILKMNEELKNKLEASEKENEDLERRFERLVMTRYPSVMVAKALNEAIKLDNSFIIFPVTKYNTKLQNCNIQIRPGSALNFYQMPTHCTPATQPKNSALSDIFFSHIGGYKLRLEAVFTTSLYLYIHVLNPPLDPRTSHSRYIYPFPPIKYTIYVLHPFDEAKHVKQSWAPDKRDEISMGPEEQVQPFTENARRYSVCYFEHNYIKDEGFLVNDTLYFMCKLDL